MEKYLETLVNKGSLECGNWFFLYESVTRKVIVTNISDELVRVSLDDLPSFIDSLDDIRVCSVCGNLMFDGWTDLRSLYACCPNCFKDYMDKTYGKDNWRSCELNSEDGYWEIQNSNNEWIDVGYYYTSWTSYSTSFSESSLKLLK